MSISPDLLELLRCPACVSQGDDAGHLSIVKETWLVCADCNRKYPIRGDIPVMLIAEGERWQNTPLHALPDTPPEPAA